MKIAYLISAYIDPKQLRRLVLSLSNEKNEFFIHIDKKSNLIDFKDELQDVSNVHWVENQIWVSWAGYSQVKAILSMIKLMLDTNKKFDRVVSLSGLDYPIWSNKTIEREYEENPEKEYIIGFNISTCQTKKQKDKISFYYLQDLHIRNRNISNIMSGIWIRINKLLQIKKRIFTKQKNGFDIYMSSDYWSLTYECVKDLYNEYNKNKKLKNYLKSSFAPSELFMATMLFNSKYANNATFFNSKAYTKLADLTELHFIDYSAGIKVLDQDDYRRIIDSGKMFARKFASDKSEMLIKEIDSIRN